MAPVAFEAVGERLSCQREKYSQENRSWNSLSPLPKLECFGHSLSRELLVKQRTKNVGVINQSAQLKKKNISSLLPSSPSSSFKSARLPPHTDLVVNKYSSFELPPCFVLVTSGNVSSLHKI
jgi:hypothetical protein